MWQKNKYSNVKTNIDGVRFDSKKEAQRYKELTILQDKGHIFGLVLQPRFLLQDKFKYGGKTYRKIEYVADFSYYRSEEPEILVIEDVKGVQTPVFKLKHKLLLNALILSNKKFRFEII